MMTVTLVHVKVREANIHDFITATAKNHEESVKEPGNLRFDVLQSADDPSRFALYEAYRDPGSAAAHKHTPHYLEWREKVAPWMEVPREGVSYRGLFPGGEDQHRGN